MGIVSLGVLFRSLLRFWARAEFGSAVGMSDVRWIISLDGTSWLGLTTTIGGAGDARWLCALGDCCCPW